MKFRIHPWEYRVIICPGELLHDGIAVAAVVFDRDILIDGTLGSDERLETLIDQLYRLRRKHYGTIDPAAIASFTVDILRQLIDQGGEAAVAAMRPTPIEERTAA